MKLVTLPKIPDIKEGSLGLHDLADGYDILINRTDIQFDVNRPFSNFYTKPIVFGGEPYYLIFDEKEPLLVDSNFKSTDISGVSRNKLFNSIYVDGHFIKVSYGLRRRDPDYILSFQDVTKPEVAELQDYFSEHVIDEKSLIIRKNIPLTVSKIDTGLNIIWRREFTDKSNPGFAKSDLFSYDDKIITNLGYTDNGQCADGHVIALNKQTGETCWLASFEHPIYSCTVIGDSVYLTSEEKWYVLSADDGSIQLKGDASEHLDNIEMYTTLSSDGRFLYFTSVYAHAMAIYDRKSGGYINKLEAPKGFNFSFDHPTIIDGFLYFELGSTRSAHIGNVYGLLITTTEEIAQGGPFNIEADVYDCIESTAKDDEQGQYYEIDINSEDVGKILHYGRITAHKLIGENTYSNTSLSDSNHEKSVNKLFNGRVDILIPKTSETERYTDKFDLICEKIKEYMKDCITPYDERELNITWSWK